MKRKNTKVRQAEIINTAIAIIGELGVSGLTTAKLAERLGTSEPALYRHFQDKEAILSAIIDEIGAVITDRALELAAQKVSPREKLKQIMASHVAQVEQRSGIPRLLFSEEMHVKYPALRDKLVTCMGEYISTIENVLAEGRKDGSIRREVKIKETARTYLGMIQFAAMRWSLSGLSFSLADEGRRLWLNFCTMLKV
jgi:TetR/AcrR family transcriptional regulator